MCDDEKKEISKVESFFKIATVTPYLKNDQKVRL